jgi:hypothetical protein
LTLRGLLLLLGRAFEHLLQDLTKNVHGLPLLSTEESNASAAPTPAQ